MVFLQWRTCSAHSRRYQYTTFCCSDELFPRERKRRDRRSQFVRRSGSPPRSRARHVAEHRPARSVRHSARRGPKQCGSIPCDHTTFSALHWIRGRCPSCGERRGFKAAADGYSSSLANDALLASSMSLVGGIEVLSGIAVGTE